MKAGLLLETKNICRNFGAVKALQHVDFYVNYGEIVGLVGDNGAGKSTLMKILSGEYTRDEGEIFFEGRKVEINRPEDARDIGIGMLYQEFELSLVWNIDVAGNIFLGREPRKPFLGGLVQILDTKKMEKDSVRLLDRLKINISSPRIQVGFLSGGQREAVAVTKVISLNSKLVIMDEPTAALAVKEAGKVRELMLRLKEEGVSIIVISHNLQDIFAVADRVVVLTRGKVTGNKKIEETNVDEIVKLIVGGD